MRLSPFFLLATSATAFRLPHPANAILDARALDPANMDPTQFSVLSVLKEAMPTGPNPPLPTGDSDPAWYQNLPLDVKELLPKFYPVVQAVAVTAEESSTSSAASSSASEPTTTASESSARISSTAAATTGNGNGTVSSTQLSSAATTSASQSDSDSLTTTSLASPSATSTGGNSSNGTTRTTSRISGTPPAATARPSIPSSASTRTFEQVPLEAVIAAWIGVAVGFAVFA